MGFQDIFKKEKKNEKFLTYLTHDEREFIRTQAEVECTSQNSIIRKSIKLYKNTIKQV